MGGRSLSKPYAAASPRSTLPTQRFKTLRRLRGLYSFLTFFGFGGAILAFSFAVWRWYFAYRHFGPAVVWRWSSPTLGASAGLTVIGFFGAIALWRSRGVTVTVSEKKLTVQRGVTRFTIPWEQIEAVYTSAVRYGLFGTAREGRAKLILRLRDGKRIRFSDAMEDLPQLSDSIKGYLYPRLLEAKRDDFNQGEALSFGPVTIAPSGLMIRSTKLSWDQLESATLHEGYLEVVPKANGKRTRLRILASKVPNVDLSLQLIQELIHVGGGNKPNHVEH
jgi:hypothetical protein